MLSYERAVVTKILAHYPGHSEVLVALEGREDQAINYREMTGPVKVGDQVVVNTTAVNLGLGSGGKHFIIHNFSNLSQQLQGAGHIMKLRYTPLQLRVQAAEEQGSPHHQAFLNFKGLQGMGVLVGELHSMVVPMAVTLKYLDPSLTLAYIMTDGAALPLGLSHGVAELKALGLLDTTITVGHAYGGDLECVNIYNGLIAAKTIARAQVAIVTMGPGIVGTGTPYGYTGVEQGMILDAVNLLGGRAIAVPRISFADSRERHRGISHHTLTNLSLLTQQRAHLVLPKLPREERRIINRQIKTLKISQKHYIVELDGGVLKKALHRYPLKVSTMGRSLREDPAFFLACGAAARYAQRWAGKKRRRRVPK